MKKKIFDTLALSLTSAALVLGGFTVVGTVGCMPDRPTAFSERVRNLGEAALKASRNKNLTELEDCAKRADILHKAKRPGCTTDELRVFNTAVERAKAGEWDKASDLLDASLKVKGG